MATKEIDRMASTAQEMARSYEAVADNFAAFQKRSVGFAQDGLKLLQLQQDNIKAVQEWWANGMKLLERQQRSVKFAQSWMTSGFDALRSQTEQNLRTAEAVARGVREQQEAFRSFTGAWTGAYRDFFTPFAHYAQEGVRGAQRATEQGLRLAGETVDQTEQTLRQVEQATRQAELEAVVLGALKTRDYDELNVEEVSKRLNGLSVEELGKVREYEKQGKNRETLIEQIDRKIKAIS